jgi:tagaturonate reductase
MVLNRKNLTALRASKGHTGLHTDYFDLPEKVLQFGTGVLLRGLPDYFIDKANKSGVFNGRVVIVKSTGKGSIDNFDQQDSIYTIGVRGIANGEKIEEDIICTAVSRVLNAQSAWADILRVARSKDLEIIISNTTEAGIQLSEDDIKETPPRSFPAKLLAVLYERFVAFNGDKDRGLVIIPTELISDNGQVLKEIVLTMAKQNGLSDTFMDWLEYSNVFCNSLVDRIVPGKPDADAMAELERKLGYRDDLFIIAEVYRLWAIEGDDRVKQLLSFCQADPGVIIEPDIAIYKELKLRLLNGSHSLTSGLAVLAGFDTVHQAMSNGQFSEFITSLLQQNLSTAIPYPVAAEKARQFSQDVLDRFRNPYIRHQWIGICVNYTLKLKMRVVPVLLEFYQKFCAVPDHIAFGLAAYLLFMRSEENAGHFQGTWHGKHYIIDDEHARYYCDLWSAGRSVNEVVTAALSNVQLWEADLSILPGFTDAVTEHIRTIEDEGIAAAMKKININKLWDETE